MTRTSLCALFATIWFTGLFSGGVTLPNLCISVLQKPETIKWKGTSENITCHIKAHSQVKRIMVKWLQDNETLIKTETIELSDSRSSVSGAVFNASLDLQSIRLNHSGMYYCTAHVNLPTLGAVEYGNGTHVYVVSNSTTVTALSPTPVTVTAIPYTLMVSLTSGLSCVLLIICIGCAIHIHYKGHSRIEPKAKEAVVDATHETRCPETHETVVYAALNIPRDSVKSRNENSAALALTSVTCTEDSVTYSEVHIKKGPKDEG
ncbi:uncharacterized protein si:dkey-63d15.12 isoform X2 [Chanodichthys erythropterus]|uniref:uncharacterized protein si:dkey-63d15.12 isoform X2 n=1 Tax=Chanodichthys erythropterus TaxID=933992 RepID=UPI00351E7514